MIVFFFRRSHSHAQSHDITFVGCLISILDYVFKKNFGFYLLTLQIPNWTINLVLHRLKSNVSEQFFLASQSATSINLGIGYPQSNRSLSIHLSFDKTPLFDCFFPLKIHDTLSCSSVRKKRAILTPFIESFVLCFQMNWSRGKNCYIAGWCQPQ